MAECRMGVKGIIGRLPGPYQVSSDNMLSETKGVRIKKSDLSDLYMLSRNYSVKIKFANIALINHR